MRNNQYVGHAAPLKERGTRLEYLSSVNSILRTAIVGHHLSIKLLQLVGRVKFLSQVAYQSHQHPYDRPHGTHSAGLAIIAQ